ncbi:importin subunit alpha-2-like isoform X1 [Zingiber officinale]|uniref:importin subunit alpha-2-like isoform X1 n=2 Tax=Zingiber officinale TaxID=94328 RepID=UPI001C4DABCB|nr:importin subunit alpha-2-like isoform X1 [Zingiber officinale]XP_042397996.1 importin subunit alpha-2-like isoform X1 [Zingiber officinale]XP_042407792.1 importin subunit alpha-2-like isoform X1 [Zingiber officinale]
MADDDVPQPSSQYRREAFKASAVHNTSAQRRRQLAVAVGKEKREALIRAKRLCREAFFEDNEVSLERDMDTDEEKTILDAQTSQTVDDLKSALTYHGKGATQKKVETLRELRRLLSKSEVPPVKAALQAGVIPLLVQCLAFGSPDEQLLEAAWCLTNIAAGDPEETKSLMPALPLLVAHIGEKSLVAIAEQCAWALGNVAGEGEELRNILLAQGALLPLARLMMSDKGSTARTAAWALSNLLKGPHPKAASELIKIKGVIDAIVQHLRKEDDELVTEVAWVVVYLSALSEVAVGLLLKNDVAQLLVGKLAASESLQLLIPVLRSLGNLVAADGYMTDKILIVGYNITEQLLSGLIKCLKNEHRVLKKEAAWVLSNIAAGSIKHKELIYSSEAMPLLIHLLLNATFDIRKEVAYTLGNLCVAPSKDLEQPSIIVHHLVSLIEHGCLPGFVHLVRSVDIQSARLGLQFLELVMRGMPNGEGLKLVEEDGIDAMERFQFHENEEIRNMANGLIDKYFGEDYGLDE